MGKRRFSGPGLVGFVAAVCIVVVMALSLWAILPKKAQAQDMDDDMVLKRSDLIELGTKYLQSLNDRDVLMRSVEQAQREIVRLQKMTNCS